MVLGVLSCCHILEFDQVQAWPGTTSVHLGSSWTTQFTLGPLTSVPSWTTWTTPDPLTSVPPRITWIIQTIQSLRLSMTLYGLSHLDLIVLLSCHSLNLTCTRLALKDSVSMPLRSLGTAPHSFPWILCLAVAWTSTFPEHTAFGLQTLPLYYTI